ncbi:MAG: HPP family protein [Planctomycetota bacterium]
MLARDVMTTGVRTVRTDTTIHELVDLLEPGDYSGAPVVDAQGKAVGLVSQSDVLRALACVEGDRSFTETFTALRSRPVVAILLDLERGPAAKLELLLKRPVTDIMTTKLVSCAPTDPVVQLCDRLAGKGIHRVIVLDPERHVLGIVTTTDLVRKLGELLRAKK